MGLSALTVVQQRAFDAESPGRNIAINSVHPGRKISDLGPVCVLDVLGFVDTDMTSHKGSLTVEQGAQAPLFLALEADLRGQYVWSNCAVVQWDKALNVH